MYELCQNINRDAVEINRTLNAIALEVFEEELWPDTKELIQRSRLYEVVDSKLFQPTNKKFAVKQVYAFVNGVTVEEYKKAEPVMYQKISAECYRTLRFQRIIKQDEFDLARVERAIESVSFYNKNPKNPSICVCFNRDDPELIKILFSSEVSVKLPDIERKPLVLGVRDREKLIQHGNEIFMKCGKLNSSVAIAKWFNNHKYTNNIYDMINYIRLVRGKEKKEFKGFAVITLANAEFAQRFRTE